MLNTSESKGEKMEREYLKKDHLIGFDKYKYNCKDTGVLGIYIMHPFWNWLIQYCPMWIAPNLLTFTGFLFTVAAYVIFMVLDYSFYASDPDHPEYRPLAKWTYLAGGMFLFIAYTLDGIDGKQARRTGTSTPLGELFDHGLDSYSAGLIPVAMYSIFGRGARYSIPPFRMYFTVWDVYMNFYLSHFEKYNTGILFLPWGYDFSMWGTIFTMLITGIGGPAMWQFKIGSITTGMMFEWLLLICSLLTNVPVITYNIYLSYKNKTGHMRPFLEAIRPLMGVFILFAITLFWILYSPGNIIERDPRAFFFLMGTIFSNISCRLIVAQMSQTRCDAFNALFIPTIFSIALSIVTKSPLLELFLTYCLCIMTTISHLHYGTCVVKQMCKHFKVDCFTIKPKPN